MSDPSVAGIYFDASDDAVTRANMLMACFPFDAMVADVDRDHHLWDEPQQQALEQICNLVHAIQTFHGLSAKPSFITNAVAAETADGDWRPIQAIHARVSKDSNISEAAWCGIILSRCFQGALHSRFRPNIFRILRSP